MLLYRRDYHRVEEIDGWSRRRSGSRGDRRSWRLVCHKDGNGSGRGILLWWESWGRSRGRRKDDTRECWSCRGGMYGWRR
jgi:hypothetical protein